MMKKLWRRLYCWILLVPALFAAGGSLAAEPPDMATISVREALRDSGNRGVPDLLWERVMLRGVLISDPFLTKDAVHSLAHFQDESAAIRLLAAGDMFLRADLERGDRVAVLGTLRQLNGNPALQVERLVRISRGCLPMPRAVTAAELLQGQHLGELVRLRGQVLIPAGPEADPEGFRLRDASGSIRIYAPGRFFRDLDFAERLGKAQSIDLVGIVEQHGFASGRDSGFGVRARDPGDFRLIWSHYYKTLVLIGLVALVLGAIFHLYIRKRIAEKQAREIASFSENLKRSETALRESNQRLATLVHSSPLAIVALDTHSNVQTWNPAAELMFGWREPEVMGHPLPMVSPARQPQLRERLERLARGEVLVGEEVTPQRKDGSNLIAALSVSPLYDAAGQFSGSMAILKDITLEKQAEEALRRSEEQLRLLLDSTAEAIYGVDLQGNCTFCNPACLRLLGYREPEDLLGKNMHRLIHHTRADGTVYPGNECPIYRAFTRDEQAHAEGEMHWRADGSSFPVELWSYPIRQGGTVVGAVVTFLDITDRKQLQNQLLHAQKMEAIGRLAGGVAHDFNNLLNVISGYSELLLDFVKGNPALSRYATEIRKAAERAASLTRQLLAFSRKQVLEMKTLNLNEVIADTEKMLRRLIGEDIQLTTVLDPELAPVKADPGQIEQILMNLAVNSRDAMPKGGQLTLQTANTYFDEAYARRHPGCPPGPYVMMAVSDTGIGMDAAIRAHLFEPFFTTKPRGQGTGLGLATVYGIVQQSGGQIAVFSTPGQGTTVKIYFPQTAAPSAEPEREKWEPALLRGSETILVVEDEPAVRELAREFLQESGYQVLEAGNGLAALELFQSFPGPIHLLLTDVIMPGISGRELAGRLVALQPDLKVLYMSGYTDNEIPYQGVLESGAHFLQKPFSRAVLTAKVRELLEEKTETGSARSA